MSKDLVISAQIRAGRALLDWTQEQLAAAAEVGLSSVREIEGLKRPADTGAAGALRRSLENEGIIFVPGDSNGGPGVRLGANLPNIIRPPTTMSSWDGLPFAVEWRGKEITVFVASEVLEDLDRHPGHVSDAEYLRTFNRHRARILAAVATVSADRQNFDQNGRLHIRGKDIFEFG